MSGVQPGTTKPDEHDEMFMARALELARAGESTPGAEPIGCVIVLDGEIVAEGHNEVDIRHDATAHAEIVTLRRLGEKLRQKEFRGAVLYSTLEPCGMCTMACLWSKVSRIVYGAGRADVHRMYFEDRHLHAIDFIRDAFRADIALRGGILREACAALYLPPDAQVSDEEAVNL